MFRKISIFVLLAFFLFWNLPLSANASGVLHAKTGEKIEIKEVSKNEGTLKWILKKASEILDTQTGRTFDYTFEENGEYNVILNLVNSDEILDSNVKILVGDKYLIPSVKSEESKETEDLPDFLAVLETLPLAWEDGKIYLQNDSGTVTFLSSASRWEIVEYRIDANIYFDSDGDWDPANDIDNQNDISLLTGSSWTTEYQKSWWKIAMQLTVINKEGEQDSTQVEIVFTDSQVEITNNTLEAKLLNLPRQSQKDHKIHLFGNAWNVTFLSNLSTGEIVEYRIDKNIYYDSDGDGNPANDIDNLAHPSFRTGENFETNYVKEWGRSVVQLTIVSADWKGSLLQREIVFDEKEDLKPEIKIEAEIWADKTEIFQNSEIKFEIKNGKTGETYKWDFDGDSEIDIETADLEVNHKYESTGEFLVTLEIEDENGNSVQKSQKIIVKEIEEWVNEFATKVPLVCYEYAISWPNVIFLNQTAVDPNLQNQEFKSSWDFGDGTTSLENSPEHTYPETWTYNITLEITDSVGNKNVKQDQIEIRTLEVPVEVQEEVVEDKKDGISWFLTQDKEPADEKDSTELTTGKTSLLWGILRILFYSIIWIVVLILLGFGGYLFYLKIQHPDFTFAELIEEEKHKLFGNSDSQAWNLGENELWNQNWNNTVKPSAEKVDNTKKPETKPNIVQNWTQSQTESSSSNVQNSAKPVPSWLQKAQEKATLNSTATKNEQGESSVPAQKPVTPANSAPAQKSATPTNSAPVQKSVTPTNSVPAQKPVTPANSAPTQKPATLTNSTPAQKPVTPTSSAPAQKPATPANSAPVQKPATPANSSPAQKPVTPTSSAPVQKPAMPANSSPAQKTVTPANSTPAQKTVTQTNSVPVQKPITQTSSTPAQKPATPTSSAPAQKTVTQTNSTPAQKPVTPVKKEKIVSEPTKEQLDKNKQEQKNEQQIRKKPEINLNKTKSEVVQKEKQKTDLQDIPLEEKNEKKKNDEDMPDWLK